MAAPGYLYTHKLPAFSLSEAEKRVLLTSSSETVETLKSRFYLDGFIRARKDGELKWAGFCIVGSANYYMHNTARHSYMRAKYNGQDIVVFWDAGLNTLGTSSISHILYKWANHLITTVSYKAAWYVDSDNIGIRFKKVSDTNWYESLFGEYLAQQTEVTSDRHTYPFFSKGDYVEVQSINVNAEGTYYSDSILVTMETDVYEVGCYKRDLACSSIGQQTVMVWYKQEEWDNIGLVTEADTSTGIFLYTDVTMSIRVGRGWYYGLDGMKSFFVDTNGEIRYYQNCDFSNPVARLTYEMDMEERRRWHVYLSISSTSDVTVQARIDVSDIVTSKAKYLNITVPAGQTHATDNLWRDLSDDNYQVYDAVISGSYDLIVTPI